jgi:hypothetical protein
MLLELQLNWNFMSTHIDKVLRRMTYLMTDIYTN